MAPFHPLRWYGPDRVPSDGVGIGCRRRIDFFPPRGKDFVDRCGRATKSQRFCHSMGLSRRLSAVWLSVAIRRAEGTCARHSGHCGDPDAELRKLIQREDLAAYEALLARCEVVALRGSDDAHPAFLDAGMYVAKKLRC